MMLFHTYSDKPLSIKLTDPDIRSVDLTLDGRLLMYTLYVTTEDGPLWLSVNTKITVDGKSFTIPILKTENEMTDFVNTLRTPLHNEYINQTLDNL